VRFYRLGTEQDLPSEQNHLGMLLAEGKGVEQDVRKASHEGNSLAMHNYAPCCESGLGVPVNQEKAYRYFKSRAESGKGSVVAKYNLARSLETGRGVDEDLPAAAQRYKQAADGGHALAMYHSTKMVEAGRGTEQSLLKAQEYYQMAVNAGISKFVSAAFLLMLGFQWFGSIARFLPPSIAVRGW
jgi:TPR repeat protein